MHKNVIGRQRNVCLVHTFKSDKKVVRREDKKPGEIIYFSPKEKNIRQRLISKRNRIRGEMDILEEIILCLLKGEINVQASIKHLSINELDNREYLR